MNKKFKILTLSDYPMMPAGVSHMMRNIINSLIQTGKYQVISLGAIPVQDPSQLPPPQKVNEDWIVLGVKEFADMDAIRQIVNQEKIDAILMMSDPRFYGKLLINENEIRPNVPIIYYSIWDNFPSPKFNKRIWESVDSVVACNKITHQILNDLNVESEKHYIPHCINGELFKKLPSIEVDKFKSQYFANIKDKFVFFWNNKNGRRKHGATLLYIFKEFLDKVGKDKAFLLMHSNPADHDGFDLKAIVDDFDIQDNVGFSIQKVDEKVMPFLYNSVDCTVNISDAEGFGLCVLESLACETPVIANLTGGMTEQLEGKDGLVGLGIKPTSKYVIGTPAVNDIMKVPYIFEDRFDNEKLLDAMLKIYNMPKDEKEKLVKSGRKHYEENFSMERWNKFWPELFDSVMENYGSWPNKKYESYKVQEL